jgi:hypothetical protein
VIAQDQLLGIRMEVHLHRYPRCARYRHPLGHRMPVEVMLEQRQGHDQWQLPLAVVLGETQNFKEYTLIYFDT